jgi:hypothetical protein
VKIFHVQGCLTSTGEWCAERAAEGYDREAYGYSAEFGRVKKPLAMGLPEARKAFTYLLKLEELLVTAVKVQKAVGLVSAPMTYWELAIWERR